MKTKHSSIIKFSLVSQIAVLMVCVTSTSLAQALPESVHYHNILHKGSQREYYLRLPQDFNHENTYWLLVVVHGGGGSGKNHFLADEIYHARQPLNEKIIIVTPSFSNIDNIASRFPSLGEGAFLKAVLKDVRKKYRLHRKVLLTGYSRGGQFSHRFALQNPNLVRACATFSAGTWSTPSGTLLIESLGEIKNPKSFLLDNANIVGVPERLHNIFSSRVAQVVEKKAKRRSRIVPFLVMCGSLDTRFEIAKDFAEALKKGGHFIQTHWPATPHGDRANYRDEFKKYASRTLSFFSKVIGL